MLKNWIIGMGMMVLLGCEAGSEDSERLVADSVELERDVSENPPPVRLWTPTWNSSWWNANPGWNSPTSIDGNSPRPRAPLS